MTPHVKIKPRETAPRTFVTDILVYFGGQNYSSRVPYLVSDTPEQRALHGQLFMKRHMARVAQDHYGAVQDSVAMTMQSDSLISFAKAGGPPAQRGRPALKLVE